MLGLVAFAVVSDGAFAVTQRVDPSMNTLVRNRWIASGIGTAAGLALAATKSPLFGACIAAGALAAGAGAKLTFLLGSVFDKEVTGSAPSPAMQGYQSMQGYQQLGAVYQQNGSMGAVYAMRGLQPAMGAVYGMRGMGALPSGTPPWQQRTPWGF